MTIPDAQHLIRTHFDTQWQGDQSPALHDFTELASQWLCPTAKPPYPPTPLSELAPLFANPFAPSSGITAKQLAHELSRDLLPNSARLNHPSYLGHMTQAIPWAGVAVEMLCAALNQNQVKIETAYASSLIERQVLNWLHQAVYRKDHDFYASLRPEQGDAIGNMVSGGTIGNLTALTAALAHALPNIREIGLVEALRAQDLSGVAILGSARMHYSIKRAVASLGLGSRSLHVIPVRHDNRVDIGAVERAVSELRSKNVKVAAIIGIAGTTETGTIDPLDDLAALAARHGIWFHVDAAWGGAMLLSEKYRERFAGIEHADSVVLDGHKLFFVPMAQGTVIFNRDSLLALQHNANYILRRNAGDLGQTSLEGSRRFDALKIWSIIKLLGTDGYTALFDHLDRTAQIMHDLISSRDCFEVITRPQSFIMTYRYIPSRWRLKLRELVGQGRLEEAVALNAVVNDLNEAIQTKLKEAGASFVSRTVLESTVYPGPATVLRLVLTNVWTTSAHLSASLDEQERIGQTLARQIKEADALVA